ncbi:MAG: hypothetical protein KDI68_13090 [Gammaproteobacteria bacterium]|nr:hypothetical protein [Gammaproteobacteria bacterium]
MHESRIRPHFDFFGDTMTHFGIFDGCGTSLPFDSDPEKRSDGSEGCCRGGHGS